MECETGLVRSLHGDGLCEPAPTAAARADPLNWGKAADPGREPAASRRWPPALARRWPAAWWRGPVVEGARNGGGPDAVGGGSQRGGRGSVEKEERM